MANLHKKNHFYARCNKKSIVIQLKRVQKRNGRFPWESAVIVCCGVLLTDT